jgi:hypothetical protein
MKFSKKADFGIIIGYMFSFFVILSIFFATFYMYQDQLVTQEDYVRSIGEGELYSQLKSSFSLRDPYFTSGQAQFIIKNEADINLVIKEEFYSCFDIFKNGNYLSQESYSITPKYSLSGDYSIIEPFEEGILSIPGTSIGDTIKVISCNGKEREFIITDENSIYFEEQFDSRVQFNIEGSSFSDVYEYQVKVNFTGFDIDFSNIEESELKFVSLLSDIVEFDLNFNSFDQNLIENSKNSFSSTLGTTSGIEGSDPSFFENGVLLSALNFGGSDLVQIDNFDALENSKEFTLSMWINQDSLSTGQIIFNHDTIGVIELGNSISANVNQIRFEVDGGINRSSSSILSESMWNHVVLRFMGGEVCLFFNTVNDVCFNETITSINGSTGNLELGSALNGKIDEVKIYSIGLSDEEIISLNKGNLRYRELDFFIQDLDYINELAEFWVKIPYLPQNENITLQLYYDVDDTISSTSSSSIENTFTYSMPRTIGYLLDQTQSNSQGLRIMSLGDNNQISVGDDSITLNTKQAVNLASGVLTLGDEIIANDLVQLTGNNNGGEMTVPISWAGTEFYYSGFRNGGDTFCMLSPFGTANIDMRENGVIFNSLSVGSTGTCVVQNIGTTNNLAIESDIPILVAYTGSGTQDPFVFYPATNSPLYGSPSNTLYYAAGPLGASGTIDESTGTSNTLSLGAYGDLNDGGNGNDGAAPAYRLTSDNPIGAVQQADGDGGDASTFVPVDEFSTLFGSDHDVSYISVVSNVADANCTVYNIVDIPVGTVATGTGVDGVYKYNFGTGSDTTYVTGPWTMSCDKPVWPVVDNTEFDDDEQNLLGYKQLRQYVYPEPVVSLK